MPGSEPALCYLTIVDGRGEKDSLIFISEADPPAQGAAGKIPF